MKNGLLNKWVLMLIFLYHFECKRDSLHKDYPYKFYSPRDSMNIIFISKVLDITNSHTLKVVHGLLVPMGLVSLKPNGRSVIVSLTPLGLDIGKKFDDIVVLLK